MLDRDALAVVRADEGGDAALVAVGLRDDGHDHDHVGDRAVGRPQFRAVDPVAGAVLGRDRGRAHARRVGTDIPFGEQERRDVVLGELGQPLALLLLGAEEAQWLGQADRLMCGQQHRDRRVPPAGRGQRLVVVDLAQPQPPVLLGDLHAEGAQAP